MKTPTKKRTLVKAIVWETSGFIIVTLGLWIYFNSLAESLKINVVITILKIIGLYFYDRLWVKIKWGKN